MVREELSAESRKILDLWSGGRAEPKNIFKVYFKNELLNKNWAEMAGHLFFKNTLASRHREIIVLRITWHCRSDYEFINHLQIARDRSLLSEDEMLDLTRDAPTLPWVNEEAALIDMTDEIAKTTAVADETWKVLSEAFEDVQIMDAIATVGGYTLNSMACNTLTVDIDPEHSRDEGLTPSAEGPVTIKRSVSATGSAPRIKPVAIETLSDKVREAMQQSVGAAVEQNRALTLARHPTLLEDWDPICDYVENRSCLSPEDTDLILLRTYWRFGVVYAFTHAAERAGSRGLSAEQIAAIGSDGSKDALSENAQLLLKGVDQLVDGIFIEDPLWNALREHHSELEMMDVVFTCGNAYMKSIFLKTLRVQLENGVAPHSVFAA